MKTKKIFIFTLIFSFLFIFTTSSFATVDYLGKQLPDFPEEYYNYKNHIIIYFPNSNYYELFLFNSDNSFYSDIDSHDFISLPSCKCYQWFINENSDSWVLSPFDFSNGVSIVYFNHYPEGATNIKQLIYSSINIKHTNSDEVFFYQTPLLPSTIMLSAISGTVWQTLAPLIIMILLVVVFLSGFHKGYRAFLRLLRKA